MSRQKKVQHKYLLPYDAKDKYHNIDEKEKEKKKVKIKIFTTWFLLHCHFLTAGHKRGLLDVSGKHTFSY